VAHGLDKYLGSSIASQETIQAIVGQMMQSAFAERDAQLQQIVNQVAAKLQQLEAGLNQVALAAQQQKMSPFEVALKAIPFCSEDATPETAEARCYDKSFAVIERWLDAALATSEAGSGDLGRTPSPAHQEEAEASAGSAGDQSPPQGDQAQEIPADNS
jgi:soluble cytochrome b562